MITRTKYAIIFPGQGSQSLGMMNQLEGLEIVRQTFTDAQEILDVDFLALLKQQTAETINQTIITQPLMLTAAYATFLAYQEYLTDYHKQHTQSDYAHNMVMAGHSLGELTALVASGVIDFKDALLLAHKRATFMQQSAQNGAMIAVIGLDNDKVNAVCATIARELSQVISLANYNCPLQVVVAGTTKAIDASIEPLKDAGAKKVVKLPVSVPSHCYLMHDAALNLANELATIKFHTPKIPVIHNCNLNSYTNEQAIKEALCEQLYKPVYWQNTIEKIYNEYQCNHIIECGPGAVLTGLNKRINSAIHSYTLHSPEDITNTIKHFFLNNNEQRHQQ